MNKKKLMILNAVLLLLLICIGIKEDYHKKIYNKIFPKEFSENDFNNNWEYKHETELYKVYNKNANIVMLGNSITYRANWNELLNRNDIANRGIGKDITNGMLNRLESVIKVNPKICFVMGGINDILEGIDSKIIVSNLEDITNKLISNNIKPYVYSILLTSNRYENYKFINDRIKITNTLLKELCKKNNVIYINLNESLSNNSVLKNDYDFDGIHLNALGYNKWKNVITPIIEQVLE